MKDSIHKYFKVGTLQWMSFNQSSPMESLYTIGTDDFFDAVEVKGYPTPEEREQAKAILSQSHLSVCYGAQPRLLSGQLNPNALDEAERAQAEAALLDALDEAEYLGAEGIAFLAGHWHPETKEQAYQQLLKTTRTLCDAAASKGMMVELEIFDYDVTAKQLIGKCEDALDIAKQICPTYDRFGLLTDLSHFPLLREDPRTTLTALKDYVKGFHLGNTIITGDPRHTIYGDHQPRFGIPNGAHTEYVEA